MGHSLSLRYSDDGGRNFTRWKAREKGVTGAFLTELKWDRLGETRAREWEICDTSNVAADILAAALMIEPSTTWADFPLPDGSYSDATREFTQQDVVNFLPTFAEGPGTRSRAKYTPAPGLLTFNTVGTGPHRGGRDVEGKCFVVSGSTLYQIATDGTATSIGTIPGTGLVSMTHNQIANGNQLLIGTGDNSYVYNTVTGALTANGIPLLSVDFLNQLNLGVDQARRFWRYSGLADATSWNTLDNESAESSPDRIIGGIVAQGEWLVFGERTIEPWGNDVTQDTAFQRQTGAISERGCINANTIKRLDNSVFFVDNNFIPCRLNGYQPIPIAPKAIVEALSQSDPQKLLAYTWEDKGYVVYYVTCQDGQTWGYDCTSQKWHRRESYGLDRWRLNTLFKWNGDWYGGDCLNGKLYRLTWGNVFEGCDIMPRRLRSGVLHNNGNKVFVAAVKLAMQTGGVEHHCPPELSIEGGVFPDTCDDADYIATINLSEGSGTYVQASFVSGAETYPPGTSLNIVDNHLTIEFFNAAAGTWRFWIDVADSDGVRSIPFECVITVHSFQITGVLPGALVGLAYSQSVALVDGVAPYTPVITSGALPTGGSMTVVGDTLVFAWPNTVTAGTYSFGGTVTDATGCVAPFSYSVVVSVDTAPLYTRLLTKSQTYRGTYTALATGTPDATPTIYNEWLPQYATAGIYAAVTGTGTTWAAYKANGSTYAFDAMTIGAGETATGTYKKSVAISPDAAYIVSCVATYVSGSSTSVDYYVYTRSGSTYNLTAGPINFTLALNYSVVGPMAFSPDGSKIAHCIVSNLVYVHTFSAGTLTLGTAKSIASNYIAWRPDSAYIAAIAQGPSSGTVSVFSATSPFTSTGAAATGGAGNRHALAWSADGAHLYCSADDNSGAYGIKHLSFSTSTGLATVASYPSELQSTLDVTASGDYLAACNYNSAGQLRTYSIAADGSLALLQTLVSIGRAAWWVNEDLV